MTQMFLPQQKGGKLLDAGHLQECSHMVIQRLLAHLLEHMRRGKLQPLWTLLLANAAHDLEAFEAKPSNGRLLASLFFAAETHFDAWRMRCMRFTMMTVMLT